MANFSTVSDDEEDVKGRKRMKYLDKHKQALKMYKKYILVFLLDTIITKVYFSEM